MITSRLAPSSLSSYHHAFQILDIPPTLHFSICSTLSWDLLFCAASLFLRGVRRSLVLISSTTEYASEVVSAVLFTSSPLSSRLNNHTSSTRPKAPSQLNILIQSWWCIATSVAYSTTRAHAALTTQFPHSSLSIRLSMSVDIQE